MNRWRLLAVLPLLAAAGCEQKFIEAQPPLEPLPPAGAQEGIAAPRVNGPVGTAAGTPAALTSTAAFETLRQPPPGTSASLGPITLDFADTDIREVATQILGSILHVNFTIDPAVKGTATLHTATPMTRDQLVATLQSLLAANNATLIQTAGFYRVVPATGGAGVARRRRQRRAGALALRLGRGTRQGPAAVPPGRRPHCRRSRQQRADRRGRSRHPRGADRSHPRVRRRYAGGAVLCAVSGERWRRGGHRGGTPGRVSQPGRGARWPTWCAWCRCRRSIRCW